MTDRWNHNIHYHPVILGALPSHCLRVLDVGCGEGTLTRRLRTIVPEVTAIDLDPASVDLARHHDHRVPRDGGPINYPLADFLTHPFEKNSFDAIVSVAALHHMNAIAALARMRELLRPGGTPAIIGLARGQLPADLPVELAAAIATRVHKLTKTYWEHPSPKIWPPPLTYTGMRRVAAEVLPGVRYHRHLLWRYSLTWTKPPDSPRTAENTHSRQ
ncbi:MAG: class I SAM-dependent methyltransferase [Pseudonocardiaceae bacterium]